MATRTPKRRPLVQDRAAPPSGVSRRRFLKGVAATASAVTLAACGDRSDGGSDPENQPLPRPEDSGIDHVVVVMMENRSFDHFLGWVPGADGRQAGLEFLDKQGVAQATRPLAPDFQNCRYEDPDHSYRGGRVQFADGGNDGWLLASTDDVFPIGYYERADLAFFGEAVPAWTTFDRYFCSILGPTFPNRLYLHAGQTDRISNTLVVSQMTSIWDRLADAGVGGTYYYSDLPVVALFGSRLLPIAKPIESFFADAAAGRLSPVTYLDPRFIGESQGITNDDHPLADIRNGQAFLSSIYDAVVEGPQWERTLLVVNYDEWGGFFDHVPPPLAPRTGFDPEIGNDGRLGFRVPCLVVSPRARRGFVAHKQYDHTSVLRMIEWRWGLPPLSVRDETAENLAQVLDFSRPPDSSAQRILVPRGPFGQMCVDHEAAAAAVAAAKPDFVELAELAVRLGFPVPGR